jgi:hypothetical protein
MADKFPNIPGIVVGIRDGSLRPEAPPAGPTVVVLGTAKKGPSKSETRVASGSSALSRFGLSGTLGRGLVEVFQGGGDNALAFRVLATKGKIEHIGDVTGAAGYTVETAAEGSDALSKISVLYDNALDLLKVFDAASGQLVYSNDPDAPVDLGVVTVTGEKALDNAFGSIGLQVKVLADEAAQIFTTDDGAPTVITLTDAATRLALLQPLSATNAYVVQLRKSNGAVIAERAVESFDATQKTVTLASAITVNAGNFAEAADHEVRFISTVKPIRADKILTNRIYANNGTNVQPLLVTPGSDFNGLPKVANDEGWTVDVTSSVGALAVDEVSPAKMNMYEAMEDAFMALEATDFSVIVMPGVYADDPALDGRTTGATALPDEALADVTEVNTIAGFADRVDVTFDDAGARTTAVTALATGGRGAFWAVFTTAQGSAFGDNLTEGELVRTARVLSWEEDADDDTVLRLFFDRDVSFSVDDNGLVVAAASPTMAVYQTDQLFYHRSVEVDGKLRHMWYPEATDEDGYTYHEVNFAYRLAQFCQEMTENEVAINGVIGVRPPTNHFSAAAMAQWIGKSPAFIEGDVSVNGTGLLGNKFVAGLLMEDNSQFDPGYKATETGDLDDDEILLDGNDFEIDMGKFLSTVASWPILSNDADTSGLGYINSGAALYAGLLAGLPSWRGATAKFIGGRGIRLPMKLAKRHQDSLAKARYVVFDQRPEGVIVVDAPSSALPTSDFTRNMTVRLVSEAVKICRDVSRPFLGDPLSGIKKAGLETALKKGLSDLQRASGGALEAFNLALTQTALDKIRGTAKLTLTLQVINELRKITVDVALAQ